jgi:hypothetical protein
MKKIISSLLILITLIAFPGMAIAGGTPKKINSQDFHMRKEGKQMITTSYTDYYIYRYYDPQTSAICYVILNPITSLRDQFSISCVKIKKK